MNSTKSAIMFLAAFAFMAAACNNNQQPAPQEDAQPQISAQQNNEKVETFIAEEEQTAALGEEANTNSEIAPAVAPGTPFPTKYRDADVLRVNKDVAALAYTVKQCVTASDCIAIQSRACKKNAPLSFINKNYEQKFIDGINKIYKDFTSKYGQQALQETCTKCSFSDTAADCVNNMCQPLTSGSDICAI